jgi:YD repeat-containing protein
MTTPAPAGQTGYQTTTYGYDSAGNLTTLTAPPASNGGPSQVTTSSYDAGGQLTSQTTGYGTPAASTTMFCYDPDGHRTAVVAPDGNTSGTAQCQASYPWTVSSASYPTQAAYQTTYSHDSAGELVSATTPATAAATSGAATSYTYDAAGKLHTATDANGVTSTLAYTPNGNTASISYSGSAAHSASYTYDADGKVTAATDATGSSSYVYNPFAELTSATNGASQTTGYGYDAGGNTTTITYPLPSGATWAASPSVTYGYDHAGLLTSVTDFNSNKITIGNTADGLPNSLALASTGDTITATYDNTGSPSAITLKNTSTTLQSFSYSDARPRTPCPKPTLRRLRNHPLSTPTTPRPGSRP